MKLLLTSVIAFLMFPGLALGQVIVFGEGPTRADAIRMMETRANILRLSLVPVPNCQQLDRKDANGKTIF